MSVKSADEPAPAVTKKKSKKKLIVIVLVAVLVAGGAYKFVLAPKPKPGPASGGDIVSLQSNTLNLSDGHYLKIAVDVQLVKGKASAATFQMSQAEELVIDEFSDRSVASLSTNASRLALTGQLAASMKKAYPGDVYQIYLTEFVTQ